MSDAQLAGEEANQPNLAVVNEVNNEELVDPRVQVELERLNTATDLINKLEIELDEARSNFRLLLSESSLRGNQLAKKLGSCVERARPYYEARMHAKQLQTQTQKAALRYERASSAHSAAKEMVYLAEEGLKKEGGCFDPAWQEMLNHATLRVNEAESERVLSQREHQKLSLAYNEAERIVQQLHQDLKKSITKSRPYFEMKAQFNQLLEEERKKVHHLEENVLKVKMSYADALHNLEEISDEIHQQRKFQEAIKNDDIGTETSNNAWNDLTPPFKKSSSAFSSSESSDVESGTVLSKGEEDLIVNAKDKPLYKKYNFDITNEIGVERKFLIADVLRIQREEISDSESLASTDTTDTLDDNQIDCLLLEKSINSPFSDDDISYK
ncbi:SH3 domain-binding protein 5-like [Parasteatoda tepidariorum]|uniref:SH3 domain-binding protein 5-like n=1 Tax=Parasteatoda tepidariorum TaxID=114398 RepID=UPI00077FA624